MAKFKRVFEVYQEATQPKGLSTKDPKPGKWRWRVRAPRNGKIVATSGENFDSSGNAKRAATTEAKFYGEAATVIVLDYYFTLGKVRLAVPGPKHW